MFRDKWFEFAKEHGLSYKKDRVYYCIIDGIYKGKELEIKIADPVFEYQHGIAIYNGVNVGNHLGAYFSPKRIINMVEKYLEFGPEKFRAYKIKYQIVSNGILIFVGLVAIIILFYLLKQFKF